MEEKMADLTETNDVISSDNVLDHRADTIPTLEEATSIFAGYNVLLTGGDCDLDNNGCDFVPDGKPLDCVIDNSKDVGKDLEDNLLKEKDLHDPNYNLVNTRVSSYFPSWRKSTSGYKPVIPVIAEDTSTKEDVQQDVRLDHTVRDKETVETESTSDLHLVKTVDLNKSDTPTTNSVTSLDEDGFDEETTGLKQQMVVKGRRHSMENVNLKTEDSFDIKSNNDYSTDDELHTFKPRENGSHKVEKNNNQDDLLDLMSTHSREPKAASFSLPNTPRHLTPPCPLPGKSRRPRRYSLADVSNMSLSILEDKSFSREIRQHQISLRKSNIRDPIIEANNEVSDDSHDANKIKTSSSVDLTSPRERAKYLQRRRASHGTIAPILPSLHLPRSPRSSVVYNPASTPEPDIAKNDDDEDEKEVSSSNTEAKDDSTLFETENTERMNVYRRNKRRSSWACTGTHSNIKPISTMDLLRQSTTPQESQWGTPASRDPYHVTVHFITDPGQADGLRNFLRPITSAIVPQFAIFNYAERSVNVHLPELEDDGHSKIPALAIVVFIQEELGAERLENAQGFLKKEPWALHHRSELGPNAVPYPMNNQDYYAHANNMPLWAVRQVHCGSDRLRCQLFVSDEHWSSSIQLYSTILGHGVQYQKEDFCFFNIYSDPTRNLEIQLSLKRLPTEYTPLPMEDVILQFKIVDMGSLVPLLPNVCSPISEKRWQTTDFDGNKILLLRGSEKAGKYTPRMEYTGVSNRRSAEGSELSTVPSDNERSRTKQRGRRHKHGTQNLTTIV